jgi:hypothetical protein
MHNFYSRGLDLRFYVEGHELDVSDPSFFMDEEEYTETRETLDEMLNTYAYVQVAQSS